MSQRSRRARCLRRHPAPRLAPPPTTAAARRAARRGPRPGRPPRSAAGSARRGSWGRFPAQAAQYRRPRRNSSRRGRGDVFFPRPAAAPARRKSSGRPRRRARDRGAHRSVRADRDHLALGIADAFPVQHRPPRHGLGHRDGEFLGEAVSGSSPSAGSARAATISAVVSGATRRRRSGARVRHCRFRGEVQANHWVGIPRRS